jgi:hypothetical protein
MNASFAPGPIPAIVVARPLVALAFVALPFVASCQGAGNPAGTGQGGSDAPAGTGGLPAGSGGRGGAGGSSATGGVAAGGAGPTGSGGGGTGAGGAAGAPATCPAVACGEGLVCERYGGPTCLDATWAAWPMPNSQPDVMAGAPNPASYTDNADGTVTDNVTKLIWQKEPPSTVFPSFDATKTYCAALVLGGYDDWRIPTRIELVSIVDYGRTHPALDPVFGAGPSVNYVAMPGVNQATPWTVGFFEGSATRSGYSNTNVVRCVR